MADKVKEQVAFLEAGRRALTAASQLTPMSAFAMRLIDEQNAAQKEQRLNQILQVLEFRIGKISDLLSEGSEKTTRTLSTLSLISLEKSDLHSFVGSMIAANSLQSGEDVMARHFIQKINDLDYLELAYLFFKTGHLSEVPEANPEDAMNSLAEIETYYQEKANAISKRLVALGLLCEDTMTLDRDLLTFLQAEQ